MATSGRLSPRCEQRSEQNRAHLAAILPPAVTILLITMEYPAGGMQGPPFSVDESEVKALYEKHFKVTSLLHKDILAENPRFRERGLNALHEHVYRMDRIRD